MELINVAGNHIKEGDEFVADEEVDFSQVRTQNLLSFRNVFILRCGVSISVTLNVLTVCLGEFTD